MRSSQIKKMRLQEVRVKNITTLPLISKREVLQYPEWARYGWDGESPMHRFLYIPVFEIKLFGISTIFRISILDLLFLTDKGSIPDEIPDWIADDNGWLWQLIGYYIHDVGYTVNYYSRLFWDCLLREFVRISAGNFKAGVVYHPVRLLGWTKYKKPESILHEVRKRITVEENDKWTLIPHKGSGILVWNFKEQ